MNKDDKSLDFFSIPQNHAGSSRIVYIGGLFWYNGKRYFFEERFTDQKYYYCGIIGMHQWISESEYLLAKDMFEKYSNKNFVTIGSSI